MKVEEIPLSDIVIPEERVRATFSDEQQEELKASIEKHGFYIPIMVKPQEDGKFELIDGEHRINIVRDLGWESIPAVIADTDENKSTMLNILANTARGKQNPMDVAEALRRAYDAGNEVDALAAATGHQQSWVKLYLTLTELPEDYQEALRKGELKVGHIQEAMRLPSPEEIESCLNSAYVLGWNVKVTKHFVDERLQQIEDKKRRGGEGTMETPPTPDEAARMIEWRTCTACDRKVKREEIRLPPICEDCRTLLLYICDQFENPNDAMEEIFNAVNFYRSAARKQPEPQPQPTLQEPEQEYPFTAQQVQPVREENPIVEPSPQPSTNPAPSSIDEVMEKYGLRWDDPEIATKLQKLKEAGFL